MVHVRQTHVLVNGMSWFKTGYVGFRIWFKTSYIGISDYTTLPQKPITL